MIVLPAIDLRGGRVVRLERGDDARRTHYDEAPEALIDRFGEAGCALVHVVDLDAAFGEAPQHDLIRRLAAPGASGRPRIELGGGLRDEASIEAALDAGCERLVLGSLVAREPERFARLVEQFPGRLVPAVEVDGDSVRVAGWREAAPLGLDALCAALRGLDCPAVLVTDVARDGLMGGPNVALAARVAEATGLDAIVSGGVRDLDDLLAAARTPRIGAAIVGKALYEGRVDLAEAVARVSEITHGTQGSEAAKEAK